MATQDFLIEIGTEELPPKALVVLSDALESNLCNAVVKAGLEFASADRFATPRRLAVRINGLETAQADRELDRFGPAVTAAFDDSGKPTAAAEGFARSCGVSVDDLGRGEKDGVEKLRFVSKQEGKPTVSLLPEIVKDSIIKLPIPKRMRWGSSRDEFVRPVHWVVMLFGKEVIPAVILGQQSGAESFGHRFHHNKPVKLASPAAYEDALEKARVIASFGRRREMIETLVQEQGRKIKARAVIDDGLLDEVTALVEWPVPLAGNFDPAFLEVPAEAVVLTLKSHQKCFCVENEKGELLPSFIAVSNLESKDPDLVIKGNERVIRPRLADARFFFEQDKKDSLASRQEALGNITFQEQLGSVADKSRRVAALARHIAASMGADADACERAAGLAKCDLLTNMVNEFADLQGLMGCYYARHDGEPEEVARAIDEQYMPRFAGDRLPDTDVGVVLALAEKLDTISGLFAINQPPTGSRDPFALRRYAIGLLRILVEKEIDLDVVDAIEQSLSGFEGLKIESDVRDKIFDFMLDRFKAWYGDEGVSSETFQAVLALKPPRPHDFDKRIKAVSHFSAMPEAESLVAANKRVSNILDKAELDLSKLKVEEKLLSDPAEQTLFAQINAKDGEVVPLFENGDYIKGMELLAELKPAVDKFFDDVLVMAEDNKVKNNRLALLHRLRQLFLSVADISELHVG